MSAPATTSAWIRCLSDLRRAHPFEWGFSRRNERSDVGAGGAADDAGPGLTYIQRDLWALEGDVMVEASDPGGRAASPTRVPAAREREE